MINRNAIENIRKALNRQAAVA
ncbi:hypothetical protein MNBD_BACTEROID05-720, partial [hydrothermal vent metagenome]